MKYAPPDWVILHVYLDDFNVLRYRENGLVPKESWHKPLPFDDDYADGEFLWRNYVATANLVINTKLHGVVMKNQQRQKVPPNCKEVNIPINDPALVRCRQDVALLAVQFKHGQQLAITRKNIIKKLFEKLQLSDKYPNDKAIIEEMAARFCVPVSNMAGSLKRMGFIDTTRNITADALTIDKRSKEYRALQQAVIKARCRAQKPGITGAIHIEDLLVRHGTTGSASVPFICPVLGIKLNLEDHKAPNSMAVWRKDVTKHFTKTNVCVMSHIASRLIEGTANVKKAAEYLATLPGAGEAWQQWCASHVTGKQGK